MALSDPLSNFGIHSATFFNRATGEPYGQFRVLGDSGLDFSSSGIKLYGGSSDAPWDSQRTVSESMLTMNVKEFPDFLFEKVLGSTVTTTATSTTGTVSAITNKSGSSIVASTGIASASFKTGEELNMKAGRYTVKYATATSVDVFIDTNIDETRGDNLTFQDDLLKITASPLTITQSAAVEIPNTGIELTGDSGVIALTATDTATFEVAHPHSGFSDIAIGATSDTIPEIGISVWGQLRDNQSYVTAELHRAKASSGIVLPFAEKGFSITPLTFDLLFDSAKSKVADVRILTGAA